MKLLLKNLDAALGRPRPKLSQHPATGRRRVWGLLLSPRAHTNRQVCLLLATDFLLLCHVPIVRLGVLSRGSSFSGEQQRAPDAGWVHGTR